MIYKYWPPLFNQMTLKQCCGSGSATFWKAVSGSGPDPYQSGKLDPDQIRSKWKARPAFASHWCGSATLPSSWLFSFLCIPSWRFLRETGLKTRLLRHGNKRNLPFNWSTYIWTNLETESFRSVRQTKLRDKAKIQIQQEAFKNCFAYAYLE